jgi:hypothetical protein
MGTLIISEFKPADTFVLKLQTSERNDIENEQCGSLSSTQYSQVSLFEKDYSEALFKGQLTPIYNCHGLTFASKRTGIFPDSEIEKILVDDKYIEIKAEKDVLPGDIVIYYDENGISHSGMVIQVDLPRTDFDLIRIMILSKWGRHKEVIHNVNYSPYSLGLKRYWRVNHGFKII